MGKLDISSRLEILRNAQNLSIYEMSEKTGLTEGYYRMIERGVRSPSLAAVDKIATALNIPPLILLNDRVEVMNTNADEEEERLREKLSNIPKDKLEAAEGLIVQAARLRVLLDDNWNDILENGEYERFQQSENLKPYDRKRPIVDNYDARDKTYKEIIKQLTDLIPKDNDKATSPRDRLLGE